MWGQAAEAKAALQAYQQVDPNVIIRKICEHYPFRRQRDRQRLVAALRRAGIRDAQPNPRLTADPEREDVQRV
jgi:hypothetical protein